MKQWFCLLLLLVSAASAQEALQAIPLLEGEPSPPSLYSSEIVREGQAKGRNGETQLTRVYRSKLLIDGNTGDLIDVGWTFYQNPSFVVPTVVTRTTGDAKAETFGYANGFLVGFLANVCFAIPEASLEPLGQWYVATLEKLSTAGQGKAEKRFGQVHVSLSLREAAGGRHQMTQTLWRDGEPGGGWSSFCVLEPPSQD